MRETTYLGREAKIDFSKEDLPIHLENAVRLKANETLHTAVIAKSGGGKSYVLRVLIENEIHEGNFVPVIFDPLGLFNTLQYPNEDSPIWGIKGKGFSNIDIYSPSGKVKGSTPFYLGLNQINPDCFAYTFDLKITSNQVGLYSKIFKHCEEKNPSFTVGEFRSELLHKEWGYGTPTTEALLTKIDILDTLGIINEQGMKLDEVIKPHRAIIFDFSRTGTFSARVFVSVIVELLLSYRIDSKQKVAELIKENRKAYLNGYIPNVSLIIDEAHKYLINLPKIEELPRTARGVQIKITAVSQSVNLSEDFFDNCTYFLIGQMNSEKGIDQIKKLLPMIKKTSDLKLTIKSLPVGCFVFFDGAKKGEKDKVIKVRWAHTRHDASTEIIDERKYVLNYEMAEPPIQSQEFQCIGEKQKEVLRFAKPYKKLERKFFTTIRLDELTGEYLIESPAKTGIAKVIYSKGVKISEIHESLLRIDTETNSREEALKALKEEFPSLNENSIMFTSRLEWVEV